VAVYLSTKVQTKTKTIFSVIVYQSQERGISLQQLAERDREMERERNREIGGHTERERERERESDIDR
jgi:hypothetical protein